MKQFFQCVKQVGGIDTLINLISIYIVIFDSYNV